MDAWMHGGSRSCSHAVMQSCSHENMPLFHHFITHIPNLPSFHFSGLPWFTFGAERGINII